MATSVEQRDRERSWTYSKLLGAPPAVKDPADRAYGDENDDRNNNCPACADHLVIRFRGEKSDECAHVADCWRPK